MMTRRVVITGIGTVTAIGHGRQGLWEGVQRGESAVRSLTRFDPLPYRARMAAEVELDVAAYLDRKQLKRLDRFAWRDDGQRAGGDYHGGDPTPCVPPGRPAGGQSGAGLGGVRRLVFVHYRYRLGYYRTEQYQRE